MANTSSKKLTRKALSTILAIVMVLGTFVTALPGLMPVAEAAKLTNVVIGVPETVYLTPANNYSTASTTVKYYVNNTVSNSGGYTLEQVNNATAGKFYVYSPQISSIDSISVNGASLSGLTASGLTPDGSLHFDTSFTMSLTNGITSSQSQLLEWTIKVTDTEGFKHALHAYTVAYNPYLSPIFAATRCKNTEGNDSYGSGLSWISGIHGISDAGGYYAKSNFLPLLGGPTQGNGTSNPDGWFNGNQQCGLPTKGGWYTSYEDYSGWTNYCCMEAYERSAVGYLNVDTSRYNNLNQIPYLGVGVYVSDSEGTSNVWAYISDETGQSWQTSGGTHRSTSKNSIDFSYYNSPSGTYIKGNKDTQTGVNTLWTNVSWNRSVSAGTNQVISRGAFRTESGGDNCIGCCWCVMNVIGTSKNDLRNLVKDCYKYTSTYYPGSRYDDFITAWRNAATVLGDPTRTDVSDVYTALNNAKNALLEAGTLTLNTEKSVNISSSGLELYYHFTPSTSGNYVFFSYGTSVDSQIYVNNLSLDVINGVGTQLAYDDDYSHSGTNTDGKGSEIRVLLGNGTTSTTTQSYEVGTTESYTVVALNANTTYLVKARCFSSNTGTFPMKVCKAVNITFNGAGGVKSNNDAVTYIMPAGHTMHLDQTGFNALQNALKPGKEMSRNTKWRWRPSRSPIPTRRFTPCGIPRILR